LVRSALAVISGYVTLILLATVVQEVWLGGVSYRSSTDATLMLAGIFTPLSAVAAGYLTALIARRRPFLHVMPMCLAIAVETTALYWTARVDGPLWFEALAGASLIAGALLGAWIWRRLDGGAG
jgi:hypothetical protein